jgi:hypothetical protein
MTMRRIMWLALLAVLLCSGAQAQTLGGGPGLWSSTSYTGITTCPLGGSCTFNAPVFVPSGTAAQGSLCFTDDPTTCFYRSASGQIGFSSLGVQKWNFGPSFIFSPTNNGYLSIGGALLYGSANRWEQRSGDAAQTQAIYSGFGGYWERGAAQELVTIAAAASTDSTADLLPAGAVIESVTVRVITAIPTAATFTVGDATTAGRFATGVATAANTTGIGILHRNPDVVAAAGAVQTTAAKVRITPNASPAAATGQVRVQVYYSKWVAPTT